MMKNKKTEKEIFALIKQSLDSYEEEYIPGAWENFLQKQKQSKRRIFLRIVAGIAACMVIGYLGLNVFHFDKNGSLKDHNRQITNISNQILVPETNHTEKSLSKTSPLILTDQFDTKNYRSTGIDSNEIPGSRENLMVEGGIKATKPQSDYTDSKDSASQIPPVLALIDLHPKNAKTDSTEIPSDTIGSETLNKYADAGSSTEDRSIATVRRKKVRFGINFSPGVNATQSARSFNYFGGISADISLLPNIQLSTGLQYENQNIVNKFPGKISYTATPANQTRTKLINLDIPVNITWRFLNEKSNSYYFSAGLSSLVYLKQEDKNTTYSQSLLSVSSIIGGTEVLSYNIVNQVSVTQNAIAPAHTFDFAGRLNIIFGVEKKLNTNMFLHLEPYVKVPVTGLATENLRHTSTGINFKISF